MGYIGQRRHLKRTNAPKSYGLAKMGGVFAIKHQAGPHSSKMSIPLTYLLRHNLKFAENNQEVSRIMKKRIIKVDNQIRSSYKFPVGLMDILTVADRNYLVSYDSQGRFALLKLGQDQAQTKLLKVTKKYTSLGKVPMIQTHNGQNIRYPHPMIKLNDTVKYDIKTNKIVEIYPMKIGQTVMAINGNNAGRIGNLIHTDSQGCHHFATVRDSRNNTFVTKIENILVVGDDKGPCCPVHKDSGIRLNHIERRNKTLALNTD
ncbi:MAG: eukaryotic ribosomal protein eS4 [Paramarteilia canceri]